MHDSTHEIIEDKIFHLMFCNTVHGLLKEEFDGGKNVWRTLDEMQHEPKRYKSFDQEMRAAIDGVLLGEIVHHYSNGEF